MLLCVAPYCLTCYVVLYYTFFATYFWTTLCGAALPHDLLTVCLLPHFLCFVIPCYLVLFCVVMYWITLHFIAILSLDDAARNHTGCLSFFSFDGLVADSFGRFRLLIICSNASVLYCIMLYFAMWYFWTTEKETARFAKTKSIWNYGKQDVAR